MSTQAYVLGGLVLLLFIVILFFVVPAFAPTIASVSSAGPFDLAQVNSQILGMTDTASFFGGPAATIQAFVYPSAGMRTVSHSVCGSAPGQPSCDDGSFPVCECQLTGSCSSCAHVGYLPLLSLGGNVKLELLPAPDAGRQGAASTLLSIVTETIASTASIMAANAANPVGPIPASGTNAPMQKTVETVSLPSLPLQKWTMVTIAREGRRFDVYYNDSIVASYKTKNMIKMDVENGLGTTSGAEGLIGQLALVTLYPTRQSSLDVSKTYATLADTRGTPFVALKEAKGGAGSSDATGLMPKVAVPSSLLDKLSLVSLCPGGNCTAAPAVRPANPFYDWDSPYQ